MRNNLTKKEMKIIDTEDLNIRYCRILERAELLDAEDIPVSDAREILYIEDILRERIIRLLGRDFYPPDRIEKKHPSNYMISLLKSKSAKPVAQKEGTLRFKVVITNSLGSTVTTLNLHVNDKGEAEAKARETIKQLGLKKATFKIG